MRINSVFWYDKEILIDKLREVSMLEDPEIFPYRNAVISLEKLVISELYPAQRYVLKSELEKVRKLKWELLCYNRNIFKLDGFLNVHDADSDVENDTIAVLPPIVEEYITPDGHVAHLINDGMHRLYMAYLEWEIPQVVYIRGLPKFMPYYAHPIPKKDWSTIEIWDDIPAGKFKKWHQVEQNKKLYRNFNSVFNNVGGPRGNSKNLKTKGFPEVEE